MSKPRTIEGRWWIHGDDKPPCFGILSLDSESLVLAAKNLQDCTPEEFWNTFLQKAQVSEVIHGQDKDKCDITLFGCSCRQSSPSIGLDSYHIGSLAGITNFRGNSWNEPRFQAARVNYTFLGEWLNRRFIEETKLDGDSMTVKFKFGDSLEFNPNASVRLKIERKTTATFPLNKFLAEEEYSVWFLFAELKSAEEIRKKYIPVFLRLLCLLTGERVFTEEISLFESNPFPGENVETPKPCELLFRNGGHTKEKTRVSYMLAHFCEIESSFDLILKRWFECDERMRPVLDLYFAVLSNRDANYQVVFLLLAHALEVYHARSSRFSSTERPEEAHEERLKMIFESTPERYKSWLKYKLKFSNQKTLNDRLRDILDLCRDETQRLASGIENFADKVRDSRNYYTHYSEKLLLEGNVVDGPELVRIRFIVEDLLKICLLKEIGIQGRPIERILAQSGATKFVHLDAPPSPKTDDPKILS